MLMKTQSFSKVNYGKFAIIKVGIVNAFPNTKKLNNVPVS